VWCEYVFTYFVASLKRRAVEQMRLEVLHKEFMLLTPFRSSKTRQSDAAVSSPTNETGLYKMTFELLFRFGDEI
jgi:hypothetical protein